MALPEDYRYTAHALRLAERGLYTTTPNPRVGCVIVRAGAIVGEGWHERAGEPHAEIHALRAAGERARGATAYISLEPCSHHGRTPPCANALIDARVARVVVALQDPNPRVAGAGLARLRDAGIEIEYGILEREARELNVGFVSRMTRGRPWVRMKIAASLDGKTALSDGRSKWITGPDARRDGHRFRARACAVLTGVGTVRDDNPQLNVREVETSRQPLRIVVDSRLETPLDAKVLEGGNVLLFAATSDEARIASFRNRRVEVAVLANASGKVDLEGMFTELARRGMNEVHVEAGQKLNGSLLRAGVVDELVLYLAPCLLGDTARGLFDLPALADLSERRDVTIREIRQVGPDLRIIARFAP